MGKQTLVTTTIHTFPTKHRPITIKVGDRVEHWQTCQRGFVFALDGNRATVMCCGRSVVGDIAEWWLV